jgi:hypothetical protein
VVDAGVIVLGCLVNNGREAGALLVGVGSFCVAGCRHPAFRLPISDVDQVIADLKDQGYMIISEAGHPISLLPKIIGSSGIVFRYSRTISLLPQTILNHS